jgi:hypothetical protein
MSKKSQGAAHAPTNQDSLREIGMLVSLMEDKIDDVGVQSTASACLLQILSDSSEGIRAQLNMPVLARVLPSIMGAHPRDSKLQATLCKCLHRIGESQSNRAHLVSDNVLSPFAQAMNNNMDKVSVQIAACQALYEILKDYFVPKVPASMKRLPKSMVEAIVAACMDGMRRHTADGTLNSFALHVVTVLYRFSPKCLDVLLDNGGISVIIRSMRAFGKHEMLQLAACNLLALLTRENNKKIMSTLSQENAASAILEAMDLFVLGKEKGAFHFLQSQNSVYVTMQSFEGANMMRHCLSALIRLYSTAPGVPDEQKGLSIVPCACIKYLQILDVPRLGVGLMAKVIEDCVANVQHLGRQGIRAAISAMVTHKDDPHIQRCATACLGTMMFHNKAWAAAIVEDDGLRAIVRNLDTHKRGMVKYLSARALAAMAADVPMREIMIKAGCAKALSAAILAGTFAPEEVSRDAAADSDHDEYKTEHGTMNGYTNMASAMLFSITDLSLPHSLQARLMHQKVVQAAVQLMCLHKECSHVQLCCCKTIENVVVNHQENTRAAAWHVTPALACAMLTHKDVIDIQKTACQLLCLTAQTMIRTHHDDDGTLAQYQVLLRECGAIKAFVHCIQLHSHTDGFYLNANSNPLHVFTYGCRGVHAAILDNLENAEYCSGSDSEVNALKALVAADFHYINNPLYDSHYKDAATCMGYFLVDVQDMRDAKAAADAQHKDHDTSTGQVTEGTKSTIGKCQTMREAKAAADAQHNNTTGQNTEEHLDSGGNINTNAKVKRQSATVVTAGCVACCKTADDLGVERLHRCSACMLARLYCSSECQKACWKMHKAECKANRK